MKNVLLLALICGLCLSAFSQKKDTLAMFLGNSEHTGIQNKANFNHVEKLSWKFKTNGKINSSPVLYENILYVGSADHNLYAIDRKTGKERWHFTTCGAVHSTPAILRDVVYFLSFDNYFYALDAKTGREKWRFQTEGERWYGEQGLWGMQPVDQQMEDLFQYFLSSPVIDSNGENPTVYFGSGDTHLYALDLNSGKLKWKFKTQGGIHTSPALHTGVIFFGSWDRTLYAVDVKSGTEKWHFATRKDDSGWGGLQGIQASPVIYQGKVYFGSRDAYFYALDEQTGKLSWEYATGGTWILGSAVAANDEVYVGTSDTFMLLILDARNGVLKNSYKTNGYIYSTPALSGRNLFFGTFTGKLVCADLDVKGNINEVFQTESSKQNSGQVLKDGVINFENLFTGLNNKTYEGNTKAVRKLDDLGPIVSTPLINGRNIYFGSGDGYLYCLELSEKK
jgi:eukaryotic-like serine/threonine-protein kinase